MKLILAVTFASIYGIAIRLLFGLFDDVMDIMSGTFLILIPMVVGAITIAFIPLVKVNHPAKAFFIPWGTTLALLIITIAFNIEGAICWVMVFPLFAILAGFGGMIVYAVKKKRSKKQKDLDDNETKVGNTLNVSLVFFIPMVLGYAEGERALTPQKVKITEQLTIAATPKQIWEQIVYTNDRKQEHEGTAISDLLGFPKHINTTIDSLVVGGKRIAYYERGLFFEEIITQYEQDKLLVLEVNADPTKIPPTVMDEHILIGGKYFDILEDRYTLEKVSNENTLLTLSSTFYVNTPFNWYSKFWATYLLSDVLEGELKKIEKRILVE